MLNVSELYVYPIKGMGGIALKSAAVSETGLAFDRYWMLVDGDGNCLTQRDFPVMALFDIHFAGNGITVSFSGETITVPNEFPNPSETIECTIWEDTVLAVKEAREVSEWFSHHLNQMVFLVRMAPNTKRLVKRHAPATVHFPDSSPFLVIGEASLHHLNSRLDTPVGMDRFRPNVVFTGGKAHEEDHWQKFAIGALHFESTKLCARCTVTTIDQQTGRRGEEPLLSLSKYRMIDRKILFGHYFKPVSNRNVEISIGDRIEIRHRKP